MALNTKDYKYMTNTDGVYDYIQIYNGNHLPSDLEKELSYTPNWSDDTLFLAQFNHSLNAGNINVNETITGWIVYRQEYGTSSLKYIGRVATNKNNITDYTASSNIEYRYLVFPETTSLIGSPMYSGYTKPLWSNILIADIIEDGESNVYYADKNNTWAFNGNVVTDSLNQNMDKTTYIGLSRYPKTSVGIRNYITGGINCMLGSVKMVNNELKYIDDTSNFINKFMKFIINGKKKLLVDRKGHVMLIDINKFNYKYDDKIYSQPTTISFEFIEIGNMEKLSVIDE